MSVASAQPQPQTQPQPQAQDTPLTPPSAPTPTPPSNEPNATQNNPQISVSNPVIDSVAHIPRRRLGQVNYEPKKLLLLHHELDYNSVLTVTVSQTYLETASHAQCAVWGTDVYTDDSDLVSVLKHVGKLPTSARDLQIDLLVLPTLKTYTGCLRNGLRSRSFAGHDGPSYQVLSTTQLPKFSVPPPNSNTEFDLDLGI